MKVTIEFETSGCHDCFFCHINTYVDEAECSHPEAKKVSWKEKYLNEKKLLSAFYKKTFPEFCPLTKIGNKNTL